MVYHHDQAGQLIAETTPAGTLIRAYVWLLGQPLAQITAAGAVYYYHSDHLGTPQRMTDSTGAPAWAADYLPFGQAIFTLASVENNLRFAGQYFDNETGLHYNYWRYYYPALGRYLRADPIGINGAVNLYSYVFNRPSISSDPFGLASIRDDFGGGVGIEGHGMLGGGLDLQTCCSNTGTRWIVITGKLCLGGAGGPFEAGISISDNPILAYGVTRGIYGKFTVCHTWILHK